VVVIKSKLIKYSLRGFHVYAVLPFYATCFPIKTNLSLIGKYNWTQKSKKVNICPSGHSIALKKKILM
jgi:hypothetical protein